jgi:hypothetical protein
MRLVKAGIIGLVGALAVFGVFGLLGQAHPASAASPVVVSDLTGPTPPMIGESPIDVPDNSALGEMQEAAMWNPTTWEGAHVERRLKLRRDWTAEDGTYCTEKGGGEVFVPAGSVPEAGLSC